MLFWPLIFTHIVQPIGSQVLSHGIESHCSALVLGHCCGMCHSGRWFLLRFFGHWFSSCLATELKTHHFFGLYLGHRFANCCFGLDFS
jgi:hypothetical protein